MPTLMQFEVSAEEAAGLIKRRHQDKIRRRHYRNPNCEERKREYRGVVKNPRKNPVKSNRIRIKLPPREDPDDDEDDNDDDEDDNDGDGSCNSIITQEDRDIMIEKKKIDDDEMRDEYCDDLDVFEVNFEEEDTAAATNDILHLKNNNNNKFFYSDLMTDDVMTDEEAEEHQQHHQQHHKGARRSSARLKDKPAAKPAAKPAKPAKPAAKPASKPASKPAKKKPMIAKKKKKPTINLLLQSEKEKLSRRVDHWMKLTRAIFETADLAPPRQTWADNLVHL